MDMRQGSPNSVTESGNDNEEERFFTPDEEGSDSASDSRFRAAEPMIRQVSSRQSQSRSPMLFSQTSASSEMESHLDVRGGGDDNFRALLLRFRFTELKLDGSGELWQGMQKEG